MFESLPAPRAHRRQSLRVGPWSTEYAPGESYTLGCRDIQAPRVPETALPPFFTMRATNRCVVSIGRPFNCGSYAMCSGVNPKPATRECSCAPPTTCQGACVAARIRLSFHGVSPSRTVEAARMASAEGRLTSLKKESTLPPLLVSSDESPTPPLEGVKNAFQHGRPLTTANAEKNIFLTTGRM